MQSFAQRGEITLTFDGLDAATLDPVVLDSVLITNQTRECDTIIFAPDNELLLEFLDDIKENNFKDFQIGNNYPNPTNGLSLININISKPIELFIRLISEDGTEIMTSSNYLTSKSGIIEVITPQPGVYIVEINSRNNKRTLRIISTGKSGHTNYNISVNNADPLGDNFKSNSTYTGFIFEYGDELEIKAYTDTYPYESINLSPISNTTLTFEMRPVPIVDFEIEDNEGAFPFTTSFNDLSQRNPTSWQWDFGDGWMSSLQNNVHNFENSGYYSITLIAGNEYGFDTLVMENAIYVKELEMFCDSSEGYSPLVVNFTAICNVPDIVQWEWDFGDGNTSNEQNPTHTFTEPGSYNKTVLTVHSGGNDYKDSTIIRVYNDLAEVNFSADITEGWTPQTIQFTSHTNISNPNYYQWSFGDGGTSTDINPVHTYDYPGVYTVILQVYSNNGSKIERKDDYITVRTCPVAVADEEGNFYDTKGIGSYCWMTENLNIGVRINGDLGAQTDNGIIEKFCYDDDDANCDTYGGLYQWDELMQYTTGDGVQGLCPSGWHVPSRDELRNLINSQGEGSIRAMRLKSESGWEGYPGNGTNESGFTALPGGKFWGDAQYHDEGTHAHFWGTNGNFTYATMITGNNYIGTISAGPIIGFSVRCVKDITMFK